MFEGVKNFFAEIRHSGDDRRKKRWLIALCAFSMLFVISFWVVNLKQTVETIDAGGGTTEDTSEDSFWSVMKRGSAIVYEQVSDSIKKLASLKNELQVKNQTNFQIDLPAITPRDIK